MHCPKCGKQIPDQSRFCLECGTSLEIVAQTPTGSRAPEPTLKMVSSTLPAIPHQTPKSVGFVVNRVDLEQRYASMSDEELAALDQSDLTTVARECLNVQLSRRAIQPSVRQAEPAEDPSITCPDTPVHQRRARHVRVVAYFSGFCALSFLLGMVFALLSSTGPRAGSGLVGLVFGAVGVPFLLIFIGLKRRARWGRTVALVFAVVTIFSPISWEVIWLLTRPETKDLFGIPRSATTELINVNTPSLRCPRCKTPVQADTKRCPGCGGLFKAGVGAGLTEDQAGKDRASQG